MKRKPKRKAKVEFFPSRQAPILSNQQTPGLGPLVERTFLCNRVGYQTHLELCLKQASNFYERIFGQTSTTYFPRCKQCPILTEALAKGPRTKPKTRKAKSLVRGGELDLFERGIEMATGRNLKSEYRYFIPEYEKLKIDEQKFEKKILPDGTIVLHPIKGVPTDNVDRHNDSDSTD